MAVAMVFIDTILLAGQSDPTDIYSAPLGPNSQKAADDQWSWINQTLAEYTKPGTSVGWIIMAGHYPGERELEGNLCVCVCVCTSKL